MKEVFSKEYGADLKIMQDIGMESKGLEFSEYMTKESLAQQGAMAWRSKARSTTRRGSFSWTWCTTTCPPSSRRRSASLVPHVSYLVQLVRAVQAPMERHRSGRQQRHPGACQDHEARGVVFRFFSAVTGRESKPDDLITMSEAVYNFQRLFNLKMGLAEESMMPFRTALPDR